MRLELNPKWKWIAVDIDGAAHLFHEKPTYERGEEWYYEVFESVPEGIFKDMGIGEGKDSLHEILPNGELRKYVDIPADGEPVIVGYVREERLRRYSAGQLDAEGRLLCYPSGATKWSNNSDSAIAFEYWRRPTKEELR